MSGKAGKNKTEKQSNPENRNPNRTLPEAAKPFMFKPGQSGNPGGRPKKKPITEAYLRLLENPANADKIAKALLKQVVKGNVFAAKEMREAIEGKALQAVRMDGDLSLHDKTERRERLKELLLRAAERVESIQ